MNELLFQPLIYIYELFHNVDNVMEVFNIYKAMFSAVFTVQRPRNLRSGLDAKAAGLEADNVLARLVGQQVGNDAVQLQQRTGAANQHDLKQTIIQNDLIGEGIMESAHADGVGDSAVNELTLQLASVP